MGNVGCNPRLAACAGRTRPSLLDVRSSTPASFRPSAALPQPRWKRALRWTRGMPRVYQPVFVRKISAFCVDVEDEETTCALLADAIRGFRSTSPILPSL